MKYWIGAILTTVISISAGDAPTEHRVRCMIQMKNYDGEGAYIAVGLVDENGDYLKTLHIVGDDDEWYYELEEWWRFHGRKRVSVDGITGPTIAGGERTTFVFQLEAEELNKGYGIRFESGVENEGYYPREIIVPLDTDIPNEKLECDGFIRYVRLLAI